MPEEHVSHYTLLQGLDTASIYYNLIKNRVMKAAKHCKAYIWEEIDSRNVPVTTNMIGKLQKLKPSK